MIDRPHRMLGRSYLIMQVVDVEFRATLAESAGIASPDNRVAHHASFA